MVFAVKLSPLRGHFQHYTDEEYIDPMEYWTATADDDINELPGYLHTLGNEFEDHATSKFCLQIKPESILHQLSLSSVR